MARSTPASEGGGKPKSKPAASSAPTRTAKRPASRSTRKPGTSATTKKAAAKRGAAPSTPRATGRRQTAKDRSEQEKPAGYRSAVAAVEKELAALAKVDPALAESTLAASAYAMARELDAPGNSATAKSMCSKSLLDTLDRIHELMPEPEEGDALDDLTEARRRRLTG